MFNENDSERIILTDQGCPRAALVRVCAGRTVVCVLKLKKLL